MSQAKKKAIRAAIICVAAGLLISFVALAALDFNFFEMGTMEPVTHTYAPEEAFRSISVWGSECDVRLLPSEDNVCRVVCRETDRITHTVTVKNGTLLIERTDDRKWYEHIGVTWNYWGPVEVEVHLPKGDYDELRIRTVSGDVEVPESFSFARAEVEGTSGSIRFAAAVGGDLSVKSVSGDIRVDTVKADGALALKTVSGRQRISQVSCRSAAIHTTSGDVTMSDVTVSGELRMEAVSGDLELADCDAESLRIKTVSGSVTGRLLTDKAFAVSTVSGAIRVPDGTEGGPCEVKTTSGDVRFE